MATWIIFSPSLLTDFACFLQKNDVYFRKEKKYTTTPLDESLRDGAIDPQLAVEQKLDIERLLLATKQLTKAQREVISLRFASELSITEVARIMGKSEGAVKALQHSAIVALRKTLSVV